MRREYEIALVIRLDASDDVMNESIEQVKTWIEEDEGKLTKIDRWGRRKLAYEIERQREGYYAFLTAEMDAAALPELERNMNLHPPILRYLVIRADE